AARQSEFNKTLARDNHRGNHHQAATRLAILIAAHFLPRLPRYISSRRYDPNRESNSQSVLRAG
ncbi:hypothetical protein L6654_40775, partial [Bradyrhizobium sp. WYCCWR 13023]